MWGSSLLAVKLLRLLKWLSTVIPKEITTKSQTFHFVFICLNHTGPCSWQHYYYVCSIDLIIITSTAWLSLVPGATLGAEQSWWSRRFHDIARITVELNSAVERVVLSNINAISDETRISTADHCWGGQAHWLKSQCQEKDRKRKVQGGRKRKGKQTNGHGLIVTDRITGEIGSDLCSRGTSRSRCRWRCSGVWWGPRSCSLPSRHTWRSRRRASRHWRWSWSRLGSPGYHRTQLRRDERERREENKKESDLSLSFWQISKC